MKKLVSLILAVAICLSLGACGTRDTAEEEAAASVTTAVPDADVPTSGTAEDSQSEDAADTEEDAEEAEEEEELSEITLAEMEILDAIDYSDYNFLTEAEFYDLLSQILALHDLEMTRYPGTNAYFFFNYSNVDSVKLLTMSKTMDEIEADRAEAIAEWEAQVEAYQQEVAAAAAGTDDGTADEEDADEAEEDLEDTAAEDLTEDAALDETETETVDEEGASQEEAEAEIEAAEDEEGSEAEEFDSTKDVEDSDDYVISFVISATDSDVDQQILFLVSAAAWAIMDPHYDNTDDAFAYLWRGLYTIYAQTSGTSASTIDGFDTSYTFTVPGNGIEAWLGTSEDGDFILAITMYAVYDELIDIAGTTGTEFQSVTSSLLG